MGNSSSKTRAPAIDDSSVSSAEKCNFSPLSRRALFERAGNRSCRPSSRHDHIVSDGEDEANHLRLDDVDFHAFQALPARNTRSAKPETAVGLRQHDHQVTIGKDESIHLSDFMWSKVRMSKLLVR